MTHSPIVILLYNNTELNLSLFNIFLMNCIWQEISILLSLLGSMTNVNLRTRQSTVLNFDRRNLRRTSFG